MFRTFRANSLREEIADLEAQAYIWQQAVVETCKKHDVTGAVVQTIADLRGKIARLKVRLENLGV